MCFWTKYIKDCKLLSYKMNEHNMSYLALCSTHPWRFWISSQHSKITVWKLLEQWICKLVLRRVKEKYFLLGVNYPIIFAAGLWQHSFRIQQNQKNYRQQFFNFLKEIQIEDLRENEKVYIEFGVIVCNCSRHLFRQTYLYIC